jgi:hypothetical protein
MLLIPAVAVENAGPGDALQRALAYLLGRPLHFAGYTLLALAGLAAGYIVVALVAVTTLNITAATTAAFPPNSAITSAGGFDIFDLAPTQADVHPALHSDAAGFLVSLWQTLIVAAVIGYVFSYAFTSSTIIYLLMRRVVDGQDPADVWQPGMIPGTFAPAPAGPGPRAAGADLVLSRGVRGLTSVSMRLGGRGSGDAARPAGQAPPEEKGQGPEGGPQAHAAGD